MNIIRNLQKRWFPKTLKCVYRKDVLEYALKHHKAGVCATLWNSLWHYDLSADMRKFLPLAELDNAKRFGAKLRPDKYWWPKGVWDTGRLDFLKWLIEQYKDDKTNLRELWKKYCLS